MFMKATKVRDFCVNVYYSSGSHEFEVAGAGAVNVIAANEYSVTSQKIYKPAVPTNPPQALCPCKVIHK